MTRSNGLVSVIMPVYNSAKFVGEAIDSVLNQSYQNLELIVVDDASTDGSDEIVRLRAKDDDRLSLVLNDSNVGAGTSRNNGLREANGRYVAFLDADDLWSSSKVSRQVSLLEESDGQVSLTYTAYDRIDESGQWLADVGVPVGLTYKEQLRTNYIGMLTLLVDRSVHHHVVIPSLRKRQDYGYTLRLFQDGAKAAGINEVLASHRQTVGSLTSKKFQSSSTVWPVYRDIAGLGAVQSANMFANYAVRGVLRSKMPTLARRVGLMKVPLHSRSDYEPLG